MKKAVDLVILLLTYFISGTFSRSQVYLFDNCGRRILFRNSVSISLASAPHTHLHLFPLKCTVEFVSADISNVTIHWNSFNIGHSKKGREWLQVQEHNGVAISDRRWGSKDKRIEYYPETQGKLSDYQSSTNVMRLEYYGIPAADNFTAVLTSIVSYDYHRTSCVKSGYYKCEESSVCVPKSVLCDGNNNCPYSPDNSRRDISDETNCYRKHGSHYRNRSLDFNTSSGTAIITVAVLTILVFISLVTMAAYFCKKARYMREMRHQRLFNNDFLDIDHQARQVRRPSVVMLTPPPYTPTALDEESNTVPPAYTESCDNLDDKPPEYTISDGVHIDLTTASSLPLEGGVINVSTYSPVPAYSEDGGHTKDPAKDKDYVQNIHVDNNECLTEESSSETQCQINGE